jgi:hypothetical protein
MRASLCCCLCAECTGRMSLSCCPMQVNTCTINVIDMPQLYVQVVTLHAVLYFTTVVLQQVLSLKPNNSQTYLTESVCAVYLLNTSCHHLCNNIIINNSDEQSVASSSTASRSSNSRRPCCITLT